MSRRLAWFAMLMLLITLPTRGDLHVFCDWSQTSPTNIGSQSRAEYRSGLSYGIDYYWFVSVTNVISGPRSSTASRSSSGFVTVGNGMIETLPGRSLPAGCYQSTASAHAQRSGSTVSQSAGTGQFCFQQPPPENAGGGGGPDEQTHPPGEPLILDLDGDGILTTSLSESPVWFDLNGNGVADLTAWTAPASDDALLFVDWNGNGIIDGGRELFGDATVVPNGERAAHGYEALAAYDHPVFGGNNDGAISRRDDVWHMLRLWTDSDHDGRASGSETTTLPAAGVVELSLAYDRMGSDQEYGIDAKGNWHLRQGHYNRRVRGEIVERALHELHFAMNAR